MLGLIKESAIDFGTIDEMSYDLSSSYLSQRYFEDEMDIKPFETSPFDYPLTDTFFDNQTPAKRLIQAIEYLKVYTRDVQVLIQLWLPVRNGGKYVLTTENKAFILNSDSKDLSDYREISKRQQFATENDSNDSEVLYGLPSLVFLKKFPICTPGFQFLGKEEELRVNYAQRLDLYGFLHLPVFEIGSGTCLGVIEIVTTSQKVNYRDELNNICNALEAVDLSSSEFLIHPKLEDCNGSYQVVLAEIRQVLKSACETQSLPLAQAWSLCAQQGRGRCQQQSAACISVIRFASYVSDPHVLGFYKACSELHLLGGEGIAGKALGTNQPCFTTDITAFSRTEYPLANHAKMYGLRGAVAIRLRSTYTGPTDFILEFFLPKDCTSDEEQKQMLSYISYVIQHVSRSLHVINDEEDSFSVKHESSWISHMLEAQQRGESVIVSMGCHKEEPEEEFKVINQWDYHSAKQNHQALGRSRRSREKKCVKTERNISLPVLQQYFPGSLKDAAKSIGVCPTTLKRICREHGIMRWPSRKIKKVGHSLKKLQLIIDSVQGAEGTIQLGSFYTNFPELSSPISPNPITKSNETTVSHSSSSGSHNSGSTLCCSISKALHIEKPAQDERKLLPRTQSDKFVNYHHSREVLVPVMKSDEGVFRVKAVYGDEKIRFSMSQDWGFDDLHREIMRRFRIDEMDNITLKFLDDDFEWVLLTCDADLEECMDQNISSKNCTIKLFLHPEHGSSFTGTVLVAVEE